MNLLVGDVREVLPTLEDQSVQMCVTSPPYWGLRDYGVEGQLGLEATPEAFVETMVAMFREVRRVLKDDAVLFLNLGDSYTSGGRSSWRSGASDNKGQRVLDDAEHRPETPPGLKPKDLIGIPWRLAFALQADGWYLRQDIIWHKPNPMPESVTDRCTKAHEYLFLLSKAPRYYFDADAIKEKAIEGTDMGLLRGRNAGGDTAETVAWHAKSIKDRQAVGVDSRLANLSGMRNRRSVWTVPSQPYSEAHFATFPAKLIEPCILAGSRPGDVVLDPFFGSGTTGEVCERLGRQWLGIELNPEYVEMAKRRTAQLGMIF